MSEITDVKVIGLTGQSGAGKTTVCDVFRANGFAIINADLISRAVMQKGHPCLDEVLEAFPEAELDRDGNVNRKKLGDLVFSDKGKLNLLTSIVFPHITARILEEILRYKAEGKRLILLDAPTLFESRADDFCELIISVIADETIRMKRIMERDSLTEERARARMSTQHDNSFFIDNSDFIIKNNKGLKLLIEKAKEVSDKIKEYYNAKEA